VIARVGTPLAPAPIGSNTRRPDESGLIGFPLRPPGVLSTSRWRCRRPRPYSMIKASPSHPGSKRIHDQQENQRENRHPRQMAQAHQIISGQSGIGAAYRYHNNQGERQKNRSWPGGLALWRLHSEKQNSWARRQFLASARQLIRTAWALPAARGNHILQAGRRPAPKSFRR